MALAGSKKAGQVDAETLAVCEREATHEHAPWLGESILAALTYLPLSDPSISVEPLVTIFDEHGQHGVAAGIAAQAAVQRGDHATALAELPKVNTGGVPPCWTARIAIALVPALYESGQLARCGKAIALGREALRGRDDEGLGPFLALGELRYLAATGGIDAAMRRTDEQLALATSPMERAWLHLVRIELHYHQGNLRQAEEEAWSAVRYAVAASDSGAHLREVRDVLSATYYDLSGVWLEDKRFDAAERAVGLALAMTPDDPLAEQLYTRAQIHRGRGDLKEAEDALVDALARPDNKTPSGDLVWAIPFDLGRVRLVRGDRAGAEQALDEAIEEVEALRAGLSGRPEATMIARLRQPYEELLGLLAFEHRWREALEVLARLDAGRLNSEAVASRRLSHGDNSIPDQKASSSALSTGDIREAAPAGELLDAWRGRHLVAAFRAGDQLCRLEAVAGELTGTCVGPWEQLAKAANRLREDPNDRDAGLIVGRALIPPGDDSLDLLLVGPIARAPTAALRDEHGLVVARRPLQRVLGLLDDERAPSGTMPARVVGFSGPPSAEREATEVAEKLGVTAAIGRAATRDVMLGGDPSMLHFAGHARLGEDVPELELADGALTADEIAKQPNAPALVVLASCESASAVDDGGWGSLAAAFLRAGSEQVIASDRAVADEEAQALMLAFYGGGGASDAARALGAAQAGREASLPSSASGAAATTWAAFTVIAAPPRVPPAPR